MSVYRLSELIWIWNHVKEEWRIALVCSFNYFSRCHWTEFWQHNSNVSLGHSERSKGERLPFSKQQIVRTFQLPILDYYWLAGIASCSTIYYILVMKAQNKIEPSRTNRKQNAIPSFHLYIFCFRSLQLQHFFPPNLDKFLFFCFSYVDRKTACWNRLRPKSLYIAVRSQSV